MKKLWKKIVAICCISALIATMSGMTVMANETKEEVYISEAAGIVDDDTEEIEAIEDNSLTVPETVEEDKVTENMNQPSEMDEDLVGAIFPGGFEVDPGDTSWLNAIADTVQAQSGTSAANVTREFLTGSYRLGELPQFWNTNVEGIDLQSSQCYGYANFFFYKLCGHTTYNNSYKVAYETLNDAGRLKQVIAASKAGAHIRVPNHSMVFLLAEDGGFYLLHWNYGVASCSYTTYQGFVDKWRGQTFFVDMPNNYPAAAPTPIPVPHGSEMSSGYDRVLPDGDYEIVSPADISYYMDIAGADMPAVSGTNVALWRAGGQLVPCDVWNLTYNNDGFYTILQKDTDMSLDVQGNDTGAGANIIVHNFHGGSNQKWAISHFGGYNGYRIQAKHSGYSLDINGANLVEGANIQQYVGNDSNAQRWLFIPYEPERTITDGRYVLVSALNPNLVLDVAGDTGNVANGANVQVWNDGADSRYYSFDIKYLEHGYYRLTHSASGKSVEVNASSTDYGANIQLNVNGDQYNQRWAIMKLGDGYMLVSRCSGYVMDVANGQTADGTNVRQVHYNGSKATEWKFVPAEYKVTYKANGGSGAPSAQTKYYRKALTLSSVKPTQSGKVFKGWATSSSATSAKYQPGASYTADKNITLYAVWETQKNPISDCAVTLSTTSYTYNGKARKPSATVTNGTVTLISGTDYTVDYSNNTNAGTATVTITGIGDYTGTVSRTFTIKKAAAKLAFAETNISKTTQDAAFTNSLTKTTDGTVTFSSGNMNVAVVDSSTGLVTIRGTGTTTILASAAAGKNYKAGSASYTLTVENLASNGFSDVQDSTHPFYNAIYWAADAGITKGYPDGTFGIDRSCTRGEMIMFLWRYAGKPAAKSVTKSPFSDVPKTHAFYNAILWGSQEGITKGYPDGTFGINRNVSRGECMMFLWRLRGKPAPKAVSVSPFTDVPKTHAFYNAILWGAQKKITNGYTSGPKKGTFGINENCTRGAIVTFLYRAR